MSRITNSYQQGRRRGNRRGFTLIEIIIAVGIFTVVAAMALAALLNMLNYDRQVQATETVMSNLNSSLEIMTRDIRFGSSYQLSNDDDCNYYLCFTFLQDDDPKNIDYKLEDNQIKRQEESGGFEAISAPEAEITHLSFFTKDDDDSPAYIVIVIKGKVAVSGDEDQEFSLQTAVSQRNPDDPQGN